MDGPRDMFINIGDDDFGCVLNCSVRYALGRRTYMPGVVVDFIMPLLPHLTDRTLWCFDQDITDQKYIGDYGDPNIDKPKWMEFHAAVRNELTRRGKELYISWRELLPGAAGESEQK